MAPSLRATVLQLAAALDSGKTTSRALIDEALARIADPAGEGKRSFTKVYAEEARRVADAQDALRRAGYKASPLAGLSIPWATARERVTSPQAATVPTSGSR